MTLDEVDLECLLLDRVAAAREERSRRNSGETLEEALTGAMSGD